MAFSYCCEDSFQLLSDCIYHMILISLGLDFRQRFVSFSSKSLYSLGFFSHNLISFTPFWLLLHWEMREIYALYAV